MNSRKAFSDLCCMILVSFFGVVLTSGSALPADKTVCSSGCDQTTIQAGINDAFDDDPSGGTVTVTDTRTYTQCIIMKDGVNLESSAGAAEVKPTIDCTSSGGVSTVTFENGPISCNLNGFNITHSQRRGAGILLDGRAGTVTTTISNCKIHNIAAGNGIRMNGSVNCTITDNTIYGCREAGISTAYDPRDTGVPDELGSNSSVTIEGNTVGDADQPNGQAGIYLWGNNGTEITVTIGGSTTNDANTISDNPTAGIRIEDIDQLSIDNNTISNNTESGILLIDVTTVSPHITNNTVEHNGKAGINIGGASSVTVGGNNIIHNNGRAGVAFHMGGVTWRPGDPSSGTVTIGGNDFNSRNDIHHNAEAGIAVIDNVTGKLTVEYNKIHENAKAGIGIFNACTAEISDNEIYTHSGAAGIFTGDWSGTYPPDPANPPSSLKFDRSNGPAILTIKRNKVYGNRAGMRLDHASASDAVTGSGQINNNLVYGNFRAGIRFSGNNISPYSPFSSSWGIKQIINNTVQGNGGYVGDPIYEDRGGGIVYDDINATHTYFYDRPVGATQNAITIKNNIVTNNVMAGIKYCADNSGNDRSYNLFYKNVAGTCDTGGSVDCGRMCRSKTLGRCDAPNVNCCSEDTWAGMDTFPGDWALGEICGQDPLFVDPDNEDLSSRDYHLHAGSPANCAGQCQTTCTDCAASSSTDMGAYGGDDPITW